MPKFQYEAMNAEGKTVKNDVTARDTDDAVAKIRELGLFLSVVTVPNRT